MARSDEPTSDDELFVLLKRKHEESSEPEDLTRYPDRLSLGFMLLDEQPLEIEDDIMYDPHWYCTREKKNP